MVPLTANDCVATCAANSQATVLTGQWALCATEDASRRYYGTWRPDTKRCWYYNATSARTAQAPSPGAAVKCGCTRPAVPVEWQADAGCLSGPQAAAVGPATCRFKKYGTADSAGQWTLGWAALAVRGNATVIVCYSATVYYGKGGAPITLVAWGTPGHNVQLLCKGAAGGRPTAAAGEPQWLASTPTTQNAAAHMPRPTCAAVPACSTTTSTEYCVSCAGTLRFTCLGSGRRCLSFTQVSGYRCCRLLLLSTQSPGCAVAAPNTMA